MNDPFINVHKREKRCLTLDLATATGYAYNNDTFIAGTYKLATPARGLRLERRRDPRIIQLFNWLLRLKEFVNPDIVVFEDVQFQSFTQQCQLWSSLRAAVWLAFPHPTLVECVNVSTLKKFATGHGGATKEMMARALWVQHPTHFRPSQIEGSCFRDTVLLDDNAIDATWLWLWADLNLMRTPLTR